MNRDVFEYKVGGISVFGDPMAIHRKLTVACAGDWGDLATKAFPRPYPSADDAILFALAAEAKLVTACRSTFGLLPYDPISMAGCLDGEVLDVFEQFTDYNIKKKKSAAASPTTQPPMALDVPGAIGASSTASG